MNNKINKKQEVKNICTNCKSKNTIKWTKRKTENRGLIQRYKCKDCNKTFTLDDGFFRMRNNPQKITCALNLFYRGVSTRKVQEHLQAFYPHNSSNVTIYNWVVKYAKMISKFTDKLKVNNGNEGHNHRGRHVCGYYKNRFRKSIETIKYKTRIITRTSSSYGSGTKKN